LLANWLLRILAFTQADVEAMLSEPDANWEKLVSYLQAMGRDEREFISERALYMGKLGDSSRHLVNGDYHAQVAAWVVLHRMHQLYSGAVQGLDWQVQGSPGHEALLQLIRAILVLRSTDSKATFALEAALAKLTGALVELQMQPAFTAIVTQALADLEASLSGGPAS
jgi:hypothetical protein